MSADNSEIVLEAIQKRVDELQRKYPEVSLKAFLEETPPDRYVYVVDLKQVPQNSSYFEAPDLALFCESEICQGTRYFFSKDNFYIASEWSSNFRKYICRNCGKKSVTFALSYSIREAPSGQNSGRGAFIKLGQIPAFGPPNPARLITLVGPDRDIFLQGRRAENRGMGIGAFAYYRRVVENQKNRIIAEIARVAKTVGSTPNVDALFAAAMNETQFSKSVEMVKDVIPQALMISGQNPLTLLHSALSKGLHDESMTDDRCLQLAQSIRTILGELAERSAAALKSDKDIQAALSTLMAIQSSPGSRKENTSTKMVDIPREPEDKS